MYNKGMIRFSDEYDSSLGFDEQQAIGKVYNLPHSCDNWVIGTRKEALQLIEDLQKLLDEEFKKTEAN